MDVLYYFIPPSAFVIIRRLLRSSLSFLFSIVAIFVMVISSSCNTNKTDIHNSDFARTLALKERPRGLLSGLPPRYRSVFIVSLRFFVVNVTNLFMVVSSPSLSTFPPLFIAFHCPHIGSRLYNYQQSC